MTDRSETHLALVDDSVSGEDVLAGNVAEGSLVDEANSVTAVAAAALGGAGWRVRAVAESGKPLDPTQSFEPLLAHPSLDLWSFGAVLFELIMRTGLWHANVDSNLANPEDYRRLAEWSVADAKDVVGRVPDRWAQARLVCDLAGCDAERTTTPFPTKPCLTVEVRSDSQPPGLI